MSDYQLTTEQEPCAVIRTSDKACIPPDMANRDYNGDQFSPGYLQWIEAGGVPDPYVEPGPVLPTPTVEDQVLYDHENRIRELEGVPPLDIGDFVNQLRALEAR